MSDDLKVFILGAPRSGTSITYYAMREILDLPGEGESHVFPIFQRMAFQYFTHAQQFAGQEGTLATELDTRSFKDHLAVYIRQFYATHYPGGRWVDKTPGDEAILAGGLVREVFPQAKILLLKRNGIEVVQSLQRKFASPFAEACDIWANCMIAIAQFRQLSVDHLEIDQFDLTNDPDKAAAAIGQYCGRPDRIGDLSRFFVGRQTDKHSDHDWRERLSLANVGWPDEQKADFERICGEQMRLFGYSM